MISDRLLFLARCPDCGGRLAGGPEVWRCGACGRERAGPGGDYLDLRPATAFAEQTKYLDAALHTDARHETVSPPLLSAGIRNDMLRRFLAPGPDDVVIDLGCGSGRAMVWNQDLGAYAVGIDVSPFFAAEARAGTDLVLGDLRRLPFEDGTFTKAYCLDVLEHLSRDALLAVLGEAARVLVPGGRLFVYTHVRQNSRLAAGLRMINHLADALDRLGWIDVSRERLRKSDHLNPLADIPDLEAVVADTGFRIAQIRYYTPLVGGFVENIMMRLAERALARRAVRTPAWAGPDASPPTNTADGIRAARADAKRRLARRGVLFGVVSALTQLMKIDLLLFGRIRSGPFFAVLTKDAEAAGTCGPTAAARHHGARLEGRP